MFLITEDAVVVCKHELGHSGNRPTQSLVTITQRRLLIEPDPVGCTISGCPNYGPAIKPCTTTLKVDSGYSDWIRILGNWVCLDTVTGFTDGTPPGMVQYIVREPGQHWVSQS